MVLISVDVDVALVVLSGTLFVAVSVCVCTHHLRECACVCNIIMHLRT